MAFGSELSGNEERREKIRTREKEEGPRERVLDSETPSDAFYPSFCDLRRNPNLLHSFPAIRCAFDFSLSAYPVCNPYNTITRALHTQVYWLVLFLILWKLGYLVPSCLFDAMFFPFICYLLCYFVFLNYKCFVYDMLV